MPIASLPANAKDRQGEIRLEAERKELHPLMAKPKPAEPREFDIPLSLTADGEPTLNWFREVDRNGNGGNGRSCQVREIWFIRKKCSLT